MIDTSTEFPYRDKMNNYIQSSRYCKKTNIDIFLTSKIGQRVPRKRSIEKIEDFGFYT